MQGPCGGSGPGGIRKLHGGQQGWHGMMEGASSMGVRGLWGVRRRGVWRGIQSHFTPGAGGHRKGSGQEKGCDQTCVLK